MSTLLLNLRNVPDDEADDVRDRPDAHSIAGLETRPSRWGVSAGSIWIGADEQAERARRLMDEYQASRATRVHAELAAARRAGTAPTWWSTLRDEPLRVILTVVAVGIVLVLIALPVFLVG